MGSLLVLCMIALQFTVKKLANLYFDSDIDLLATRTFGKHEVIGNHHGLLVYANLYKKLRRTKTHNET